MVFEPCLLIPCYNHGAQIGATVAALERFGLPCLIVDDGSDAATAAVLDQLAAQRPALTLLRLPVNGGKGEAVIQGIRELARRGFSHALQIDADGQHDVEDVPHLLAAAGACPEALVSGWPQYGADIPKSRLYGRAITHFWTAVETLSGAVKDAMCGFRVYPVAAVLALDQRLRLGRRMDFDIEVMVRLYWAGTPLRFVPTRVIYPPDGVSHFAVLRDNLRISWMHTRLTLGMLPRIPRLLLRRRAEAHWSQQRERGAYWAMWFSLQGYRLLGPRLLRVLLYPIIAYFYLTNRPARIASKDFLQRVYRSGGALARPPGAVAVYRHFYAFGESLIDRLASWAGAMQRSDVEFPRRHLLQEQARSGRGALLFTSHLGNVEMCRALVEEVPDMRMNVLVFTRHAEQINRLMQQVNPRATLKLIAVETIGPDTAQLLLDKIDNGEFVVIAADRTSPSATRRVAQVDFLGAPALFPHGPFILASLLRCPVYLLFCLVQDGRHSVHLEPFADPLRLPRKQRETELTHWAQRYAERLEFHARRAPLQWFNFFDFWRIPAPVQALNNAEAQRPALPLPAKENL